MLVAFLVWVCGLFETSRRCLVAPEQCVNRVGKQKERMRKCRFMRTVNTYPSSWPLPGAVLNRHSYVVVQSLSGVQLFATP